MRGADRGQDVPPVQRPGGKEAQVLEDVEHAVALGLVVQRRHVPQPEDPGVEDHRERGVGDEPGAALDRLDAPGRPGAAAPWSARGSAGSARGPAAACAGPCASPSAGRRASPAARRARPGSSGSRRANSERAPEAGAGGGSPRRRARRQPAAYSRTSASTPIRTVGSNDHDDLRGHRRGLCAAGAL